MNLGNRIRARRQELGMTQTELANKLGLKSKASVSKVELGEDNLTNTTIKRYAEALETTTTYLLGLEAEVEEVAEGKYLFAYKQAMEDAELLKLFHKLPDSSKKLVMDFIKAILPK